MKKVFISLITLSLMLMAFPTGVFAGNISINTSIQLAQTSGEQFIHEKAAAISSEWSIAELAMGEPCYDLQGNVISYMFTIMNKGESVGFAVVGNALYNYQTLEASSGLRPSYPSLTTVKNDSVRSGITLNNAEPVLSYLGYGRYYAVYGTGVQKLAIDMVTGDSIVSKELSSSLTTPMQFQKNVSERNLGNRSPNAILTWGLLNVPIRDMADSNIPSNLRVNNCGPTSGAMISEWWRANGLSNLPTWTDDHNELYDLQWCNNWYPGYVGTPPWTFGDGITQFWADEGYSGYSSDYAMGIYVGFSGIEDEIDNGRPMGIMFSANDTPYNWHWCVIKGYFTDDWTIVINNSWGEDDVVSWSSVDYTSSVTRIYPS